MKKVEDLNEAVKYLCRKAGQVWLETNSTLLQHALDYEAKLNDFLTETGNALQVQWDHTKIYSKNLKQCGAWVGVPSPE